MLNKIIGKALAATLLLSFTGLATAAENTADQEMMQSMGNIPGMDKCYGVAKAGMNDCGTASHHCAGEAKKDGSKDEWLLTPTGLCSKLVGGSTQPPAKR